MKILISGENHGQGSYFFSKTSEKYGDKYVGEYLHGKRTGKIKIKIKQQLFLMNVLILLLEGKGVYSYHNKDEYVGEFLNGSLRNYILKTLYYSFN